MDNSAIALVVSGASIALALCSLAWNVWQKFIHVKPAVQVTFSVMAILQGGRRSKDINAMHVTNMGPGPVIIHACIASGRKPWSLRKEMGILNPIHGDPTADVPQSIGPFSGGLPAKIEPGEVKGFFFPFSADCFLREQMTRYGVSDTYGRLHWCRRRDATAANERFHETFPDAADGKSEGAGKG